MRTLAIAIILSAFWGAVEPELGLAADSRPSCAPGSLAMQAQELREAEELVHSLSPSPIEQLLQWEAEANLPRYRQSSEFIDLEVVKVRLGSLRVEEAVNLSPEIKQQFIRDGYVHWPKHPLNTDSSVPYFGRPGTETWSARYTASRSIAIWDGYRRPVTVKLPTNQISSLVRLPKKAQLKSDIEVGVRRSRYIAERDRLVGAPTSYLVLTEALSVQDPQTGNGFIVRDLGKLAQNRYYLPAFAIPYLGAKIARMNGRNFEAFWAETYATPAGKLKADLLLRYGLQHQNPNAQNILIEFDRQLRPTGRLVLRDISDTEYVEGLSQHIPEAKPEISRDHQAGYILQGALKPQGLTSFFRFEETELFKKQPDLLRNWANIQNDAYMAELKARLGIHPRSETDRAIQDWVDLRAWLDTADGEKAFRRAINHRSSGR